MRKQRVKEWACKHNIAALTTSTPTRKNEAAICVRNGLSEEGALKAITINAAKAIGLADRVGSLEAGKDADVCLYDMHPLDARAHVKCAVVNGSAAQTGTGKR